MRSKKLRRQISKYLDYEDLELDLTEIIDWVKKPNAEIHIQENIVKVFENFQYFLDSIDSSYEQLESNLNHAQRSLEISGIELEERNRLLRQENKKVSSLLNNMRQAVFAVKQDGTVVAPVSKHSFDLFGEEIVGKNLFDILYKDFDKNSEKFSLLKSAFISVFGENELQWSLMEDQFPETIQANLKNLNRILKISTRPMWDEHENLEKIMYLIEDITEWTELNKKLEIQHSLNLKRTEVLQEMISSSRDKIDDAIKKVSMFCRELDMLVQNLTIIDSENYSKIYSVLHTIKGNSRVLGFKNLAITAHETEGHLTHLKNVADVSEHQKFIKSYLKSFFDECTVYIDIYNDFFNTNQIAQKNLFAKDLFEQKLSQLKDRMSQDVYFELKSLFDNKLSQKFKLESFLKEVVLNTASKFNKKIQLEFISDDFSLSERTYSILENSLLHIIQNAIDHGIEDEKTRKELNKNVEGKVEVVIQQLQNILFVTIKDDGSGIDKNKLLKIANDKGISADFGNSEEILNLIFKPGITTKDIVSEISGRGMGLDGVFTQISQLNGKIKVTSKLQVGTQIKLEIPSHSN